MRPIVSLLDYDEAASSVLLPDNYVMTTSYAYVDVHGVLWYEGVGALNY